VRRRSAKMLLTLVTDGCIRRSVRFPTWPIVLAWMGMTCAALPASGIPRGSLPPKAVHQVRLIRDSVGMAHLYADREEDGYYGLGYATGADRLRQVLTWYVAVRGELAATFGPKTPPLSEDESTEVFASSPLSDAVASDINTLKYQLLPIARRNFRALPPQYQRDLRSYVAGLSAYMRDHPERTPAWAPVLEPALPMALLDFYNLEAHGVCEARRKAEETAASHTARLGLGNDGAGPLGASNAWAVAGSRTADGHVIMESDSHGLIEHGGTLFYPYRIKAGDLDFTAFSAPAGSANFLFGHSPYFAWGITEGPRFVADCYRVAVDHTKPQRFLYDGKWLTMTVKPYTIAVKNSEPVKGIFEYTRHNGVLSPVEAREGDTAYVVSYASADRIGLDAGEYYRLAKARTRQQLEAVLAQRDAYPANMVIGGADGTIIYIRPGRVPIRHPGLDVRYTLDGNTSATAWLGIHPYSQMLKLIDPLQGYVSNSNVSPDMMYPTPLMRPEDFPSYFAFQPGRTNARQQRLIELLDHASKLFVDGAMAIAMDETIPGARRWALAVAHAVEQQPSLVANQPPTLVPILHDLAQFDGTLTKDSRAALYQFELRRALLVNHRDIMDTLVRGIDADAPLPREMQQLLIEAAEEARKHLIESYGRTDLTWGDVHRVGRGGIDLPVGGGVLIAGVQLEGYKDYAELLHVDPPVTGTATLRALVFSVDPKTNKDRLIWGQRVPFVVHFTAAGAQSYAQTLWGVSDDPTSPHYSDQARFASDKVLRPIPMTLAALRREGATETVLTISSDARTSP
jgi:acyl-homoserine-lactone acylase